MGNKLGLLNFLATWLWAFPNTAIKLNLDDYLYGKQLCLEFYCHLWRCLELLWCMHYLPRVMMICG
jgi:hypothetical protein